MVIYSLCTARRVLFSVETIRLSGCFRVCVCSRKCFHRLKNKKEFPGQVFCEHLVPPLQLLCAVFIDQAIVQIQMNAII